MESLIARASSGVRFVAWLIRGVPAPTRRTIPLRTMRRFVPRLSISCSVLTASEPERFETMMSEKVPKKTPSTASEVRHLNCTSERRAIFRLSRMRLRSIVPSILSSRFKGPG